VVWVFQYGHLAGALGAQGLGALSLTAPPLIVDQVRAGLIVRMAVLYDLLTTGPVAVETTVEVPR